MTSGGTGRPGAGDPGRFGAGDGYSEAGYPGAYPGYSGAPHAGGSHEAPGGAFGMPAPGSQAHGDPYGNPTNPYGAQSDPGPSTGGFGAAPSSSPYGQPDPYGMPAYGSRPQGASPYDAGPYGTQQFAGQNPDPGAPYGGTPYSGDKRPRKSGGGGKAALIAGALVLTLVAGGVGGVVGAQVADRDGDSSGSTSSQGPIGGDPKAGQAAQVPAPAGSVQDVAAKVLPSVVSLDVTDGQQAGEGSGIILSNDGVIMTNNHVISAGGSRPGQVVVNFNDGSRADAKVLGFDRISDIAVIKVDRTDLKAIEIGTSKNLAVGQDVIAVGAPLGLQGTVTTGIISALNRPVSTSRESGTTSVIDAIQTDAAINPGNSGGALVNAKGALIGVNTAIATLGGGGAGAGSPTGSIGLGFAIPIDQARRVANELLKDGKATQAGLGVSVRSSPNPQQPGAEVSAVTPNGPAAKAGIPNGAVVTRVDDRTIATGDALVAAVRSHAPGDTVSVTFVKDGQDRTVQVTLEELQTN